MNIALIGATGYTGSRITQEALGRGHRVTAIVRNANALPRHPRLTPVSLDVTDPNGLAGVIAGHDVVISAFNPGKDETGRGVAAIIEATKRRRGTRLLVVGGAGTLEVAPGKRLVDQPDFPTRWKEGALKTAAVLDALRAEADLDWTFVSPAALLSPGERTGKYRVGGDRLLTDSEGKSRITLEDFAAAMIDEAEDGKHSRAKFSVAH